MEKIKIKQLKIEPVNIELDEPFTIAISDDQPGIGIRKR